MIIFINGTFGVGKTTIAEKLRTKIHNSIIFDPEEVGFFLRNVLGKVDSKEDFQDYPAWRSLTVSAVKQFLKDYQRTLIVPMTIAKKEYFTEIVGELERTESDVHHFCLIAPIEVIQKRLAERGEGVDSWQFKQATKYVPALGGEIFQKHIDTVDKSPDQIVENIINLIR